jgi:Domain of unknown function (DUF4184)
MPFTPFHLIAITPLKAAIPRRFSWSVFALTNIVIDLEPISFFLITLNPAHRFFHTFLGATLVALFCAKWGVRICEITIDIWNEELRGKPEAKWFKSGNKISSNTAWISAIVGSWTHIILDSLMHDDIKPFSPFLDINPVLGLISIGHLLIGCLLSGFAGLIFLYLRRV